MNTLRKNLSIHVKNPHRIRSIFSVVHPNSAGIRVNDCSNRRGQSIQLNLNQKCLRTKFNVLNIQAVQFSSDTIVTQLHYEKFCAETLDSLCDYIEELVESVNELATADVLNKVKLDLLNVNFLSSFLN